MVIFDPVMGPSRIWDQTLSNQQHSRIHTFPHGLQGFPLTGAVILGLQASRQRSFLLKKRCRVQVLGPRDIGSGERSNIKLPSGNDISPQSYSNPRAHAVSGQTSPADSVRVHFVFSRRIQRSTITQQHDWRLNMLAAGPVP